MEMGQNLSNSTPTYSDEIDLRELFAKLWAGRWWLVGTTAMCVVIAMLYLMVAKPTYEVTAYVRPPLSSNLNEINLSQVMELSAGGAFARFRKSLVSKEVMTELFNIPEIKSGFMGNSETAATKEQLFIEFEEELRLHVPVAEKDAVLVSDANSISFQHFDPEYAVKVVNWLVDIAEKNAIKTFVEEFEAKRTVRIKKAELRIDEGITLEKVLRHKRIENLEEVSQLAVRNAEDNLDMLRKTASQQRADRIEELKEAMLMAKQLKIINPTTLGALTSRDANKTATMKVNTEVSNSKELLYLKGVNHLGAELDVLAKRTSDDFSVPAIRNAVSKLELLKRNRELEMLKRRQNDEAFIMDKIAPLRDEIQRLKNVDIDAAKLSFSRVDQPAVLPVKPLKPRKLVVLAVAVLLGGMLGLLLAFIVPAIRSLDREPCNE